MLVPVVCSFCMRSVDRAIEGQGQRRGRRRSQAGVRGGSAGTRNRARGGAEGEARPELWRQCRDQGQSQRRSKRRSQGASARASAVAKVGARTTTVHHRCVTVTTTTSNRLRSLTTDCFRDRYFRRPLTATHCCSPLPLSNCGWLCFFSLSAFGTVETVEHKKRYREQTLQGA